MKKLFIVVILYWALSANMTNAQSANWQWAKAINGGLGYNGLSISPVIDGCFYVAGNFATPDIIFANDTLTQSGNYSIFLARYDQVGNLKWVKGISGAGAFAVSIDKSGNAFITGQFDSTVIFDEERNFAY